MLLNILDERLIFDGEEPVLLDGYWMEIVVSL